MQRLFTPPANKPQEIEDIALRIQSNMSSHVPHIAIFGKNDSSKNKILQFTVADYEKIDGNYPSLALSCAPTSAKLVTVFEICSGTYVKETDMRINELCDIILVCVQNDEDINDYQQIIKPLLTKNDPPLIMYVVPEEVEKSLDIDRPRNSMVLEETDTKKSFYTKLAKIIEYFADLKLQNQPRNSCTLI